MAKSKGAKGFKKLIGVTITEVDDSTVNQVVLVSTDGDTFTIDAEVVDEIPRLSMKKKAAKKPDFSYAWPYPAAPLKEKDK